MKSAHELCLEQGVDRERLRVALSTNDNWGGMVHAFEYLTAVSAVLASWPPEEG